MHHAVWRLRWVSFFGDITIRHGALLSTRALKMREMRNCRIVMRIERWYTLNTATPLSMRRMIIRKCYTVCGEKCYFRWSNCTRAIPRIWNRSLWCGREMDDHERKIPSVSMIQWFGTKNVNQTFFASFKYFRGDAYNDFFDTAMHEIGHALGMFLLFLFNIWLGYYSCLRKSTKCSLWTCAMNRMSRISTSILILYSHTKTHW